jgi:hypothetical protein
MKAFRASAKSDGVVASTPRAAAELFFAEFPSRRKCDIVEGTKDGSFFTVRYGKPWPQTWKGVTGKSMMDLPG